jgi:hypothetical protein
MHKVKENRHAAWAHDVEEEVRRHPNYGMTKRHGGTPKPCAAVGRRGVLCTMITVAMNMNLMLTSMPRMISV